MNQLNSVQNEIGLGGHQLHIGVALLRDVA